MERQRHIKYVGVAILWFDRVNGNTYHSVRITRTRDGKVFYCPFQCGYGEQYRQTALEAMEKAKWLPKQYNGKGINNHMPLNYLYERENNCPILWVVTHGTKKECKKHGLIDKVSW